MRALLLGTVLFAVTGCLGQVGELPSDLENWAFDATVQVNPDRPVAGRAVSVKLQLTSHSNTVVLADVVLRVVRQDRLVYEETFRGVKIHPEEVWSLTQGFVSATDDGGALDVEVLVRDHETGEMLWSAPKAAVFMLN